MNIKAKDFKKIKPFLKKTVSKVKVKKKIGLPFFLFRFRHRKLFFISIVCAFIFLSIMSSRLWTIQLEGNQIITEDVLTDFLDDKDVVLGIRCKDISCEEISREIREHFPEVKWVSVSLDGTVLRIILKENHDKKILSEIHMEPCDIIANKKGTITKLVTRTGVPMCNIGAEVEKGDLLISGKIDVLNDAKEVTGNRYVTSDAEIWAETIYSYQDSISKTYLKKTYQDKIKYKTVFTIGKYQMDLSLYKDSDYLQEKHVYTDTYGYPCSIQIAKIKEYEFVSAEYSEEQRKHILEGRFMKFCEELEMKGCKILENDLHFIEIENRTTASSVIKVEEKIGENRKIFDLSSENMVQ